MLSILLKLGAIQTNICVQKPVTDFP